MSYQIAVTASGGGPTFNFCVVRTLEEGAGAVSALEAMWKLWEESGYPDDYPDAVRYMEGCDVYATNTEDPTDMWTYVDEWEKVDLDGLS